jgi:hypothetical protein
MKGYILSLGTAMKSAFFSCTILNAIDDGSEIAKNFKDEFIEDTFANASNSVIRTNSEEPFKGVSHDDLLVLYGKIMLVLIKYLI